MKQPIKRGLDVQISGERRVVAGACGGCVGGEWERRAGAMIIPYTASEASLSLGRRADAGGVKSAI